MRYFNSYVQIIFMTAIYIYIHTHIYIYIYIPCDHNMFVNNVNRYMNNLELENMWKLSKCGYT